MQIIQWTKRIFDCWPYIFVTVSAAGLVYIAVSR
jgi:hypothetical protein